MIDLVLDRRGVVWYRDGEAFGQPAWFIVGSVKLPHAYCEIDTHAAYVYAFRLEEWKRLYDTLGAVAGDNARDLAERLAAAEAERDRLAAKVARVERWCDQWEGIYPPTFADIRAALADPEEPQP